MCLLSEYLLIFYFQRSQVATRLMVLVFFLSKSLFLPVYNYISSEIPNQSRLNNEVQWWQTGRQADVTMNDFMYMYEWGSGPIQTDLKGWYITWWWISPWLIVLVVAISNVNFNYCNSSSTSVTRLLLLFNNSDEVRSRVADKWVILWFSIPMYSTKTADWQQATDNRPRLLFIIQKQHHVPSPVSQNHKINTLGCRTVTLTFTEDELHYRSLQNDILSNYSDELHAQMYICN
jgi:hypothetical protein